MTDMKRALVPAVAALLACVQAVAVGEMATRRFGAPPKGGAAVPVKPGQSAKLPTAYIVQTKTPPTLDGKCEEECWKSAQPLQLARTLDGGGAAAQPTDVRLLYDDAKLYLAFRCAEPLLAKLNSGASGRDVDVWGNDSVEFFLSAGGSYYHFGVNAAGGVYDAQGRERSWDSGFKAAVAKTANQWCVEAAIPLDKLTGGKTLPAEITGNFHRNRYVTGELEESAWSPTFSGDSHVPEKFGKLVFGSPPAGGEPGPKPAAVPAPDVQAKGVEVLPVSIGEAVVRFDLTELKGAKILRADLALYRTAPVDGQFDEVMTDIEVYPLNAQFKAGAEAKADSGAPALAVRGPWFDTLDATAAIAAWAAGKTNGGFFLKSAPMVNVGGTCLDVVYEGKPPAVPPQASDVNAVCRNGQTFITWKEIDEPVGGDQPTWGQLKAAMDNQEAKSQVRYCVYRSDKPVTADNLAATELLAQVKPLSCWNSNGRNIERPIDIEIATKDYKSVGQWNPFGSASADGDYGRDCPIDRLVIEDGGKPLDRGTGLYVHTPKANGKAYYAVVTMVDGVANTQDMAKNVTDAVAETPAAAVPVLQRELPKMPMFNYPEKRLHYVEWAAPPQVHVPSQYYNWSVGVPDELAAVGDRAAAVPLELSLHRDGDSYWRTQFRIERNSIVVSPNDFPIRSWWYGYHENYGTLKSFGQGVIQPYTERRLLAFVDWAARKWPVDRNRILVAGCRGGASAGGALRLGLRHPEVFCLAISGHGSPTYADLAVSTDQRGLTGAARGLQAIFGKPQWALKTETGKGVYEQLDMNKLVAATPPTAELPLVTITSGNKGPIQEFHRLMLEAGRPIIAEFSWGGGRYIPVTATGTYPNAIRMELRRDASMVAFCTAEAVKLLGGAGIGEFNRNLTWRDAADTPEKYEVTICDRSGRSTADITVRRLQKFKVAAGKNYHWSVKDLVAPPPDPRGRNAPAPPPAEGDATVGDDGLLRIKGVSIGGETRLTVTPK